MKSVTLGELCEIRVGRTPSRAEPAFWGVGEPWVSIADLNQGHLITGTKEQITPAGALKGRQVPTGTVLLSFKLTIGKVALAGMPLYTNEAIAALLVRDSELLDTQYLLRSLEAMDLAADSNRAAMGATLNRAKLEAIRIPLPSLTEQHRIAAILDQADAIRTKRRQVLTHLDTLPQSIFHDMFGAPGSGRWDTAPLGEVTGGIANGNSPNCESRPAIGGEWGVLKLGAVTYGVFRPEENKAFLGDVGAMSVNEVRPGDVLMTRKNTRDLVGAVALVDVTPPRLLLPDLIFRLTLDRERLDPRYFQTLMMNPLKRPSVRDLSSGSAASMPNISKARLRTLPIELPPLSAQRDFATRVERIATHRAAVERALAADDELFASLQSRAFRGEL